MDFERNHTSNSNTCSPHLCMTAPNSPTGNTRSMEFYYSAPASPSRNRGPALDEFQFETSRRFDEPSRHDRRESLPAMAFAEDLFFNGLVMPLKPPPRLHSSPLSSPKSPRTVCRIPFSRKNSWNDDFDPFAVALEKVREEKRGRNGHHRRLRSYSPFRALSRSSSAATADDCDQDLSIEAMAAATAVTAPVPATSHSGPLDFKGSAYARWVRDQNRHGLSPKSPSSFLFRQRVRPLNGSSPEDTKMAVVQYKPSIAVCLGYGVGSTVELK